MIVGMQGYHTVLISMQGYHTVLIWYAGLPYRPYF